jgi:hypothetical protein
MEDRIQVNGEWYVKELITTPPVKLDLTHFEGCVYENSKYCFEVTRIYRDYNRGEFYPDSVSVEFTDKRAQPWKTDHWDNTNWLLDVHHNDKSALNDAFELMDGEGVRELKDLIRDLIEKGWITYQNYIDHRIPGEGC